MADKKTDVKTLDLPAELERQVQLRTGVRAGFGSLPGMPSLPEQALRAVGYGGFVGR